MTLILKKGLRFSRGGLSSLLITPRQPVAIDPYFSNVLVLLRGNGENNSTAIADSSPSPKTATAVNGAKIVTGVADPFGNSTSGVISFTASTSSRVELSKGSVWNLPGNLTIELWAQQGAAFGVFSTMFEFGNTSTGDLGILYRPGDSRIFMATTTELLAGSFDFTPNTWLNWVCVRAGSIVTIYRDGDSVASKSRAGTLTNTNATQAGGIYLGDSVHAPGRPWNGYVSNLRITKDIARYATGTGANAGKMVHAGTNTLALPTAPFPDA
jgi:hypothetical protein